MSVGILEHVNITVSDPLTTAARLSALFNWKIRWSGDAKDNGFTVHVGEENSYLAIYSPGAPSRSNESSYKNIRGLNHVGVVVEDLDAAEQRVIDAGFTPNSHGDYEPGRRFYFHDDDGIEFEVISYTPKKGDWKKEFFKRLGDMSAYGSLRK